MNSGAEMNARERQGIGKLFEAFTRIDSPAQARVAAADAVRLLAGGVWAHVMDLKHVRDTGQFTDYSCGALDNLPAIAKAHGYYTWRNQGWQHVFKQPGKVYRHAWCVGEHEWYNSEFQVDFTQRIAGMTDIVVMNTLPKDNHYWSAAVCHPKKNGIKPHTLKMLEWLLPHLGKGLGRLDQWERCWQNLEALSENTDEPLVLLRRQSTGMRPKLILATRSATAILGLIKNGADRNLHLQEFLHIALLAIDPSRAVRWTSKGGAVFRLTAIQKAFGADTAGIVVRLEPNEPIHRITLKDARLTRRETGVFALLIKGHGNREIGRELNISEFTARAHVRNIFSKLKVSNRVEAVNAVRKGLE